MFIEFPISVSVCEPSAERKCPFAISERLLPLVDTTESDCAAARAAIEAADIVLMDDDPMKIVTAMSLAKRTLKIVRQNIWFALGVKGAVLLLSVFGFAPMWLAIFADVGVAVIAILNAMRTLK